MKASFLKKQKVDIASCSVKRNTKQRFWKPSKLTETSLQFWKGKKSHKQNCNTLQRFWRSKEVDATFLKVAKRLKPQLWRDASAVLIGCCRCDGFRKSKQLVFEDDESRENTFIAKLKGFNRFVQITCFLQWNVRGGVGPSLRSHTFTRARCKF